MRFFRMRSRGLTLLEVVIVAGMVAVVAMVVFTNVSEARKRSRDVQRVADLSQLQIALKLYNDAYGTYKVDGAGEGGEGFGWISYVSEGIDDIKVPPDDGGYDIILPADQKAQLIYGKGGKEGYYPKAITAVLYEKGFLPVPYLNDPRTSSGDHGYILLLCDDARRYALFATMENVSGDAMQRAEDMCNGAGKEIVSQYGKNYAVGN
jgi:type II secretory pathway pseudopilin PulG